MNQTERMKELIALLNKASKAYYAEDTEIMSNYEYDKLYDELVILEEETGITMAGSPTVSVGYEAVDALPKERHEKPMLSLAKTKSREELSEWLGEKEGLLSWKLDGLTIVVTYENGTLSKAVTRGNGEVGEVVTNNARVFKNLPAKIPYTGTLTLRGEAVIPYSEFEKINASIKDVGAKYKNPRNLCSGSVRQLNNEVTAERNVYFYAFSYVIATKEEEAGGEATEPDFKNDRENHFKFLKEQGFDVVEYIRVNAGNVEEAIESYSEKVKTYDIPSDGLVLSYCDLAYSASLGLTAKFPRHSIAFKWADEIAETTLREVEWSPSRTGLINPVAIFDEVQLEGTSVSRASLHNISYMKALELGIGDRVTVYKANMIIPQLAENLTRSGMMSLPGNCPACGGAVEVQAANEAEVLCCINPECPAKKMKSFALFVSRDAINIDGMSEATLEKFIGKGFIQEYADLFNLDRYKDEITRMEGFGEKSYARFVESAERARKTSLPKVIYSLGIPGIGLANAKVLCKFFDYDLEQIRTAGSEQLAAVEGIGEVLAGGICEYFAKEENNAVLDRLLKELEIEKPQTVEQEQNLDGKVFVITGSLNHFGNRNELKELIEQRGGKVTGSVTSKTTYLINNDITSTSGKNKKAKELGVEIVDEETFLFMAGIEV
ncbi:MAG: NAD-dependent DNA ligase LigA [Lachnospiraceae bacterium]|nr:NAD-dependent DNA ligase LigA [Lachnospiraceae bacterium]